MLLLWCAPPAGAQEGDQVIFRVTCNGSADPVCATEETETIVFDFTFHNNLPDQDVWFVYCVDLQESRIKHVPRDSKREDTIKFVVKETRLRLNPRAYCRFFFEKKAADEFKKTVDARIKEATQKLKEHAKRRMRIEEHWRSLKR